MTSLNDTWTLVQAGEMQSADGALPNLQSISNRPGGTLRARFEASKPAASDHTTPPAPYGAAELEPSRKHSDAAPAASAPRITALQEGSESTQRQTTETLPQQLQPQDTCETMQNTPPLDPGEVQETEDSKRLIAQLTHRLTEQASQLQQAQTGQRKVQGLLQTTFSTWDPEQTT